MKTTTMHIASHEAVVMKKDGHCMISVTLTVFDVVWVFFEDTEDNWEFAIRHLRHLVSIPLKQMWDEYTQATRS